ncbi:diguanylate cyclase domain protein [[Clostridium] bifermentans ATCC 19299]|uniref:sensor domain-containing diguanylate cyclase/phosphohydrolase n=1 Tax=Paraclostridium bifermentans TaxID=1490 RepID=UPI00038D740E|nr:HD domain-containing phosphohydrolase [Paraclostridium bifermentans]EQK46544.1 diguanylate cyclase domain protein [[Clostridium] bifermentans ATCC 19299] [Paraclostridium bifermentans ATCC 19299]
MKENLMDLIFNTLPIPIWIKSKEGAFLDINQKFKDTYISKEINKEDIIGKFNKDIYPVEIAKMYDMNYEKVLESKQPMTFENKHKNKITKAYLTPVLDKDKEIIAVTGIIHDISEFKQYEEDNIYQKKLVETIINSIPDIVFYKDKEGKYVGGNNAFFEGFYEKDKIDVIGKTDVELSEDKNLAEYLIKKDKEVIDSKKNIYSKLKIRNSKNEVTYFESIKTPVINEKNEVVGVSRDITKRKELENMLRQMSYTDKLTGLFNRAYFEEQIKILNNEKFYPLSMIIGDANGLKKLNDTRGHLEGDKLIIKISEILKNSCNERDLIFRWGGDEFIILMPNTNSICAQSTYNTILENCKKASNYAMKISIALGISTKVDNKLSIEDLIKEAEDTMYQEKLLSKESRKNYIMKSLQKTLEEKSLETRDHTGRTVEYAYKIGKRLNLNSKQIRELKVLAYLHDIGKIGVCESIIEKPGPLTQEEYNLIKNHSEKGFRIANCTPDLSHVAYGILTHHERYDGNGYPLGLKGEEIPLLSRIISVVDAFDAMTSDRAYRKAMSKLQAIEELRKNSGTQFDSKIVDVFIEEIESDI